MLPSAEHFLAIARISLAWGPSSSGPRSMSLMRYRRPIAHVPHAVERRAHAGGSAALLRRGIVLAAQLQGKLGAGNYGLPVYRAGKGYSNSGLPSTTNESKRRSLSASSVGFSSVHKMTSSSLRLLQ